MLDLKHKNTLHVCFIIITFTQEGNIVIFQSSVATESLMKTHVSYIPIP